MINFSGTALSVVSLWIKDDNNVKILKSFEVLCGIKVLTFF